MAIHDTNLFEEESFCLDYNYWGRMHAFAPRSTESPAGSQLERVYITCNNESDMCARHRVLEEKLLFSCLASTGAFPFVLRIRGNNMAGSYFSTPSYPPMSCIL